MNSASFYTKVKSVGRMDKSSFKAAHLSYKILTLLYKK